MKSPSNRLSEFKGKYRAVGTIVATVFLGAIGSGLWEVCIGPIFAKLGRFSLTMIASLFDGYVDSIYKQVSRNPSDLLVLPSYSLVVTLLVLCPWLLLAAFAIRTGWHLRRMQREEWAMKRQKGDQWTETEFRRWRKRFIWITTLVAVASTVFYSIEFFKTAHSLRAFMFIDRSIEILSPHIVERQRIECRARIRAIETAAEFYAIEEQLRTWSKEHGVKLPEFEAIRPLAGK